MIVGIVHTRLGCVGEDVPPGAGLSRDACHAPLVIDRRD
nr:MAG TPA: hypothetical protein [Caudoviricetes sp.]